MLLYDVDSLSTTPSLSTAVLSEVISLSNLSGLIQFSHLHFPIDKVQSIELLCFNDTLDDVDRETL